jgi:NADH-quinone oxidoreductase subunit M
MNSPFPVLSVITLAPIAGAILILLLPKTAKQEARIIAAAATGFSLLLGLFVYFNYDVAAANAATTPEQMFQFQESIPWVEALGINYHLGVDGISAPMVLLTGLASFAGVLISWGIEERTREFMAFFLLLVTGVYGVFVAMDLFVLFFFYELAIFPMYLLIVTWGWKDLREYASMKLTLYILVGSVIALVGVLAMYFVAGDATGTYSFDITHLMNVAAMPDSPFNANVFGIDGLTFARAWFPFIFLGFGVLAGVFPFHNWSPDGHVAAPTAVSMIHAGVLMKLGAYSALRVAVQLLPQGAQTHLPWIVFLTLINVVYGAFIAMRQRDFKYVIGFSSVSHMGLVSMGWATMNVYGMTGAGLQMFSHGVMTALFFSCVGMVYDRAHTRDIPSLGGFRQVMPWVAFAFIVGGLVSMGMPGLSGFVAEFPIFTGLWDAGPNITLQIGSWTLANYYGVIAVVAVLGIIVTAAYVLRVVQQVFFGEFNRERFAGVGDVTVLDKAALVMLLAAMIILGVWPSIMAPMVESGVAPIIRLFGGGA